MIKLPPYTSSTLFPKPILLAVLTLAGLGLTSLRADTVVVESGPSGQNTSWITSKTGFSASSGYSTASGCTATGSFYASSGTADTSPTFTVQPTLGSAGGYYEVDVTYTSSSVGSIVADVTMVANCTGLPATTPAFTTGATGVQGGNVWNPVGVLKLNTGQTQPTITFTYHSGTISGTSRMYCDGVRFVYLASGPPSGTVLIEASNSSGTQTPNPPVAYYGFSGLSTSVSSAPTLAGTKSEYATGGTANPWYMVAPTLQLNTVYAVEVTVPSASCSSTMTASTTTYGTSASTIPASGLAAFQSGTANNWINVGTITPNAYMCFVNFQQTGGTLGSSLRMYGDGIRFIPTATAGTRTWNGGSSSGSYWTDINNWGGSALPNPGGGDAVVFTGSTRTSPSMDGPFTVSSITFDGSASAFTVAGSGGSLTIGSTGIANNSANNQVISANISQGSTALAVATGSSGKQVNLSGTLAGTGGYSVSGNGTLYLNNSGNTISGTVTVNSGATLELNAYTALGANSSSESVTLNGGTLQNDDTTSGDAFLATGMGGVTLNSGGGTFNVSASASTALGITGTWGITGTGALTKTGTGTLTLNNGTANTYGGGTVVNAGTLEGGGSGVIPGNVTVNVGTLKLDSASALASGATLTLPSSPSGNVTLNFSGTQTISTLYFGGTSKAQGTWGATASAQHQNSAFTGSGLLQVNNNPNGGATTTSLNPIAAVCAGSASSLTATVSGVNSPSGNVQFFNGGSSLGTAALSGGAATLSYTFATGSYSITATYLGDDLNNQSSSGTQSAVVSAVPSTATVGGTQNICGSLTSGGLGGNTPSVGSGSWSKTSGPGNVTFSASTSGSSTATVDQYGTYVFTWTISNGACTPSTANVTVNYYQTPTTANAGSAQTQCETSTATLAGNTPTVGTGAWTLVGGSGTITTPSSPTSGVTGLGYGVNTFQWTISNGTCTPSTSQVTITRYQNPTTASVGGTQNICGSETSSGLGGNTPSVGSGSWSKTSGPGNVTFSASTSGSSTATVDQYGTYVFTWTISNGTCTPSTADVTVNFNAVPDSTITAAAETCANSTTNTASAPTQAGVSYLWTISNGTIQGSATGDSITYTAGGSGSVSLSCAVTNTTTQCGSSSSASVPAVVCCTAPAIVGGIDPASTNVCAGSPVVFTLTNVTGTASLFYQWRSNSVAILDATNASYTNLSVAVTDAGGYDCVVTNACGAITSSPPATLTVNQESADPTSASASPAAICNGGSTTLTFNGGGGGTGETIAWYTGSCGGTSAGTGNSLSVSPTTSTTYYGRYEDGAPCNYNSACAQVTVTVNTPPTAPNSGVGNTPSQTLVFNTEKLLAQATGSGLSVTAVQSPSAQGGSVDLASGGGTMSYTAPSTAGIDSFTYTITDVNGCTASPTIYVTNTVNSGLSPNLVSYSYDSESGTFSVTFAGIPNFTYTVQYASAPGAPWYFLKTATAGTDGLFEVTDTPNPPVSARYYRTVYY